MEKDFIYLDHASTTYVYPEVIDEINRVMKDYWGNPSNLYDFGQKSKEIIDESKKSFFRKDIENRIISCLGGMASEEHYYKATTSGVENDLAQATSFAVELHKAFGMSKEIGPVHLLSEENPLDILNDLADLLIQDFLKDMYKKAKAIINEHADALDALTQALLDKEVVYSEEVSEILKKYHNN